MSTPEESYAPQSVDPSLSLQQQPNPSAAPSQIGPNSPPWGVFQALCTVLASMALLVLLPLLLTLPYLFYHYQHAGIAPTRELLIADKLFIFLNVLSVFPAHFLTLAMVWAVVTRFGKLPFWFTIGWSWGANFGIWKSAGVAIALFVLALALGNLFREQPTEMERLVLSSRMTAYAIAILATATAPFVEELVYRGVLFAAVQRAAGVVWATVIVAGLFAGIHVWEYWPNFGALSTIVLLSFALTLVRAHTGRILPGIVIHLIFNGIQSVFIILQPYLDHLQRARGQKAALTYIIEFAVRHVG